VFEFDMDVKLIQDLNRNKTRTKQDGKDKKKWLFYI